MEFLPRLSSRERLLLGGLSGLLSFVFLLSSVVLPVVERRDAAYRAMIDLRAEKDWFAQVQLDYSEIATQSNRPTQSKFELIGLSEIETSLHASGLRENIVELGTSADDEITLRLRGVEFVHLMPWLQGIERDTGYRVIRLELFQGEQPGVVVASISMK